MKKRSKKVGTRQTAAGGRRPAKKVSRKKAASPARKPAGKKKAGKAGARRASSGSRAVRGTGRSISGKGTTDLELIERLIHLMSENDLLDLEVRDGPDHKIRLSRRPREAAPVVLAAAGGGTVSGASASGASGGSESAAVAEQAASAAEPAAGGEDLTEFVSPMVGTFYRASSPEAPPYISTGDRVTDDSVLCIIEAMKVMNEIKAEIKGEVVDILVENGEAVEYGQPLFLIRKSG